MSEEKAKRKNDEEAYIHDWVRSEQTARQILSGWFILVTVVFFLLANPFQYFGNPGMSGFLIFYVLLISAPAIAGIIFIFLSNDPNWTRNQIEKSIAKPDKLGNYAGILIIVLAIMQFIIGGGEQKFLIAPCLIGAGIFWHWRNQKYQGYLALTGQEKAK